MTGNRLAITRRLIALIRLVQTSTRQPDLAAFAQAHGVTVRTVYRDLLAIEAEMPVRWRQEAA